MNTTDILYPLTADEKWWLGGDDKTLKLLKRRTYSVPGMPANQVRLYPVERIGHSRTSVMNALLNRDIKWTEDAATEIADSPEYFWQVDPFEGDTPVPPFDAINVTYQKLIEQHNAELAELFKTKSTRVG